MEDTDRYMDAEIAAALDAMPVKLGELNERTLPKVRAARALLPPAPRSGRVLVTDVQVPAGPNSEEGAPDIPIRVYRPDADATGAGAPVGVMYWMHGGGLVLGSHEAEDARFDRWCDQFNIIGVSVGYRLAPETPYPGPLEDCYQGLLWVHEQLDQWGMSEAPVGIGGASAGAGLAAGLALLARERSAPEIAWQLLIYPMLDDRQITPSSSWEVPIWNPASNDFGWRSYLGEKKGSGNVPATAAPARATDLSGLPPAFICVGTLDGFVDEDIDYAMRLNQAGVPVELHVYPGAPHGFDAFTPDAALAIRAREDMEAWLASQLNG